jgi:cystathionine gamma-synthase
MSKTANAATIAARAAIESDTQHGAVVPPLHLSSNYAFAGFAKKRQYDYTRSGNPTRDALGNALAELEGGVGAVITPSGMGALNVLVQLLQPGELLLVPHDCYGGTFRLYEALARKGHFEVLFVDQTDDTALRAAIARGPKLILAETPSNPLLRVVDIAKIAALAKECGAIFAVDNTFLSPALQQPIELGADIVVHSTTKYINGHSDVVGGAIVAATSDLLELLTWWANCIGATGAPFDSYLTLRGLRTLKVRMRQHEESANELARVLDRHSAVKRVYYPGLAGHPGHEIAVRQQQGFGGMLSFDIKGGEEAVRAFVESLQYFSLAESLGGVESLVCHPPTMTHAPLDDAALARAGISQSLIRLSIGLEATEDLVADVLTALEAAIRAEDLRPVAAA